MMKKVEVLAQYPIPTLEQLRHRLLGSNRYSIVYLNDAFHQFPLDEESKEISNSPLLLVFTIITGWS